MRVSPASVTSYGVTMAVSVATALLIATVLVYLLWAVSVCDETVL
jgi:hypothetical protein